MSRPSPAAGQLRPMRPGDLDAVIEIERTIYSHPWSLGNFRDSLHAGYSCWALEERGVLIGYCVMMLGVGEAHLLNLSVAPAWQRRGLGRAMLASMLERASQCGAREMLLEVRPSNVAARALYVDMGFRELSLRRGYYPSQEGREDAILMARACGAPDGTPVSRGE